MINILKLCVGADSVEDLLGWQRSQRLHWPPGQAIHVTRMWPKREAEVLEGSLYWVIKGIVQVRQRILDLRPIRGGDGIERCGIVLDPELHRTEYKPCRAFQGWRYLVDKEAPADIRQSEIDGDIPEGMRRALRELALI